MLRRKPTRIELKIDDLEEYNKKVKERESANRMSKDDPNVTPVVYNSAKSRMDMIHARIGYDPKPLPQPSTLQN